jgi:hypothetical protein
MKIAAVDQHAQVMSREEVLALLAEPLGRPKRFGAFRY